MTELFFWKLLIWISFGTAIVVFIVLFFFSAPYGRYTRKGWGKVIPANLGWLFMESPSAILFAVFFFLGTAPKNAVLIVFFLLFEAHYVHRAFIYPFMRSDGKKEMPMSVMFMGVTFNLFNAYINSRYLFEFSGGYPLRWLMDPRFIAGVSLFVIGFIINRWADDRLHHLRKPGESGYKIPSGGLFNLISSPNYFGEIIEWFGWALATWSIAGLSFAAWTFANLAPRANSNHNWYHEKFAEYPEKRKALIPGIW